MQHSPNVVKRFKTYYQLRFIQTKNINSYTYWILIKMHGNSIGALYDNGQWEVTAHLTR